MKFFSLGFFHTCVFFWGTYIVVELGYCGLLIPLFLYFGVGDRRKVWSPEKIGLVFAAWAEPPWNYHEKRGRVGLVRYIQGFNFWYSWLPMGLIIKIWWFGFIFLTKSDKFKSLFSMKTPLCRWKSDFSGQNLMKFYKTFFLKIKLNRYLVVGSLRTDYIVALYNQCKFLAVLRVKGWG